MITINEILNGNFNHPIVSLKGRKSIYAKKEIFKGESLTKDNLTIVRPFDGLHPKYYNHLLGKKINKDLKKGSRINLQDIE